MTTRTSTRNAADLIAARQPFTTSGALRGGAPGNSTLSTWDCGRLPGDHVSQLMGGLMTGHVDYIVYSYGTPIAWHRADAGWTVPDVRYSATTSRHQGVVRRAVA